MNVGMGEETEKSLESKNPTSSEEGLLAHVKLLYQQRVQDTHAVTQSVFPSKEAVCSLLACTAFRIHGSISQPSMLQHASISQDSSTISSNNRKHFLPSLITPPAISKSSAQHPRPSPSAHHHIPEISAHNIHAK